MAFTRWQRIQVYCKTIWGANQDFDIEQEEVYDGFYMIFVREDLRTSFGKVLTTVALVKGQARAWDELEKHLARLA